MRALGELVAPIRVRGHVGCDGGVFWDALEGGVLVFLLLGVLGGGGGGAFAFCGFGGGGGGWVGVGGGGGCGGGGCG